MSTTLTIKQYSTTQQPTQDNGELIVWTGERLDFDALQDRMRNTPATVRRRLVAERPASYVVFDVLAVKDVDLRSFVWSRRRARLETLAAAWSPYPD